MARIRNVKPAFFQNERIHEAEVTSGLPLRLAYIGLWTQADRRGLFRWRPKSLRVNILPYDTVDFGKILSALEEAGFITRYEVGGETFGCIPTFGKHQRPHVREQADTDIPSPPAVSGTTKVVPEHNLGDSRHAGDGDGDGDGDGGGDGDSPPLVVLSDPPEPESVSTLTRDLANRADENQDVAGQAIRELVAVGVPVDRIRSRIDAVEAPIGAWAWKASVLAGWKTDRPVRPEREDFGPKSPSSNGALLEKIAEDKARAASDIAAFHASGCASRSEWMARKAATA